ncbi:MAG: 3'-5' exoribonuclease YhaM family protein [Clostridiaceae bacterium]
MSICNFKVNDKIDDYFVIKSVECKVSTVNNNRYLDLILVDKSGEINGKLWRVSDDDINSFIENTLIKVKGAVIEWQGNLQLRIDKIKAVTEKDNVVIDDFVPSAPLRCEEMMVILENYLDKISNYTIKEIVTYLIDIKKDKLLTYPAASKNHHSIRGGLLYHITTMLRMGEKVCEVYNDLDRELLFGGIILHDLAKIDEMNASPLGIVSDYSMEGQLLGHISQGIKMIETAAEMIDSDKEIVLMLQHMVLSHHYEAEYGSPKKPMFPEAQVLHFLDKMDASLFDMRKALTSTNEGEFSEGIWSLEKRRVYKRKSSL